MRKRLIGISAIAFVHAALCMAVLIEMFDLGMRRFDTGADPASGERILHTTWEILSFPILSPVMHSNGSWFHGKLGGILNYNLPLVLNSLVWGTVIWMTWEWIQKKRETEPSS